MFGNALLLPLVWTAISVYLMYWVIRLAVRHALQDRDRQERRTTAEE